MRRLSWMLALWLGGLPGSASEDDKALPQDPVALMAEALRARDAGRLGEAAQLLRQLAELAPDDERLAELLQAVQGEMKEAGKREKSEEAGSRLDRVPYSEAGPRRLEANEGEKPDPARGMLAEARQLLGEGQAQEAMAKLRQLRVFHPELEGAEQIEKQVQAVLGKRAAAARPNAREAMLGEVDRSWERPFVLTRRVEENEEAADNRLKEKLEEIVIPRLNFNGVPLSRVVDTVSALSEEYDPAGAGSNIVLIDPAGTDPMVTISLRGLPLTRCLDFITESVGYEYEVQVDAVLVRPGQGPTSRLETDFFPLSRSTIIRLTGLNQAPRESERRGYADPFSVAAPVRDSGGAGGSSEEEALKDFLERAGVSFRQIDGANLAVADGQLIVTQTPHNMEKVRNILRRYTEVKQVEIEARFLEVRQGDLEELGFDWAVRAGGSPQFDPHTGNPVIGADGRHQQVFEQHYASPTRSLAEAFGVRQGPSDLSIQSPDRVDADGLVLPGLDVGLPVLAPKLPSTIDLGAGAGNLASLSGVIGTAEVNLIIRALERRTGNDLMSAPKVTVLSGKTAEITVAQELRYPERYGDIEAQVGRGDSSGSGSAGVAITAGTPQDFVVRNIGVEMSVTPTVEDDNAISLLLEPRVTEFEGFVEYGGTSVAIASNTTVTVPSGFFQPIFSVRRVRTEVTIWDGATVVMGGLTREQAVSVQDKVPVLGDIPLLGRLFRSEAESTEKRNLLIFVTANLISPGGSPQRQAFSEVEAGALFQNPQLVTPAGAIQRKVETEER